MIGDSNHNSGLVSVQDIYKSDELTPEEIIALENAEKYDAHYVYFRRFENRPSIPQIYLYDFTKELGNEGQEERLITLHKQLYSSGKVPLFFVFTKKDVRIFNCLEHPSQGNNLVYKPLTVIKLASELQDVIDSKNQEKFKDFSGKAFDNGSFWENTKYSSAFKASNSAYEKLLSELKLVLNAIIEEKILPPDIARKIMVISILVKYLEEREDERGNRVFPNGFFTQFSSGATRFTDILTQAGSFVDLLDYLAEHFNGGIFQLDDTERDILKKRDLSRFKHFFDGEVDGIQLVLWRLYSFNDLPVELISNIYEEFLGKQPGVVYTPPFLVNFLLDEAMPLTDDATDFRILDPACGSGVFLVGAYRRLIYRWRKKNDWQKPDLRTLKKLLKENIYGVELNKEAANLTIFSLSLALCDALTPLQIWNELKFDNLNKENILNNDFFEVLLNGGLSQKFNLIIGNPPFESKLTTAAKKIEIEQAKNRFLLSTVTDDKKKRVPVKLPDNQIALLFLEKSISLCRKNGLVCLIQPSGPFLYNNTSFQFRQFLLANYHIPQIIDFTHISRVLFGKNGDVATAAVFIENTPSKERSLLHVTVRRTKPHKEKLYFELDTYDFHIISHKQASSDPYVWKSNFLGGKRFSNLLSNLKSLPNVGDFLSKKITENGWDAGEGYIIGNRQEISELNQLKNREQLSEKQLKRFSSLNKKYKKADFITNKPTFDSRSFTKNGLSSGSIYNQEESYFIAPRRKKIYQGPHILIKELVQGTSIPILYTDDYLTFKHRIVGIHAPESEKEDLKKLFSALRSKINLLILAATSAEFMVNRSSSFLRKDLDTFIIPDFDTDFKLQKTDEILIEDLLEFLLDFRRKGEKSKIATKIVSKTQLQKFGELYCQVLNSVFKTVKPYPYLETESYICYPFYFGEKPNIDFSNTEYAEKSIEELVQKNFGVSLRITRIIRLYEGNVIYLIKPKKLRFWLKSIALRDADETFSDLRRQGY
tara:strand:+ start:7982 stop:10957 length:2976 start_codon:yes stop_codon:yes gene_type:complete